MNLQLLRRTAQGVATCLVGSCPTFSPLPHLRRGGYFLLRYFTLTDNFHIKKQDALCCPDFPLAPESASGRPILCFYYIFYYMLVYKSEQNRSSLNVNSSGILFMSTAPAMPFTLPFEVYCHKTYWRSSISVGASR